MTQTQTTGISTGPISTQRLLIHDLLFIDRFTVSGDMCHC